MALIKCTECGQMVSDKAEMCPNCGCPIEKKIVCEECGGEIGPHDHVCPSCGCPVPENKKEKESVKPTAKTKSSTADYSEENVKKVKQFLAQNMKKLPMSHVEEIRSRLLALNEEQFETVRWIAFKDTGMMLIISILVGGLGVDRFILGDMVNGALKLLLTLCCGIGIIWWLIDIFYISDRTLEYNYNLLMDTLDYA